MPKRPSRAMTPLPEKPLLATEKPPAPKPATNASADLLRYDRMFVATEGMPHAGTVAKRFALRDELASVRAESLESGLLDRAKARLLAAKAAPEAEQEADDAGE